MSAAAKILVVDDEPDLVRLVRQKFRRELREGELDLLSARNGVEALAVLEDHADVEVALCDINMPRMDGLTLLEALRERHPLVKAVMLSAYGDMDNIRGAMHRGAFDFLTKPLDLRDLEVTVARALDHARRGRDAIRRIRENHVLRMYVNDALFRYLDHERAVTALRPAETITATVAFVDVCGFTRLCEREPPERLVELLDEYFDRVARAVVSHGGVVDKFIGDAVMAVFREEGHAKRALLAVLAARDELRGCDGRFAAVFGRAPGVTIGIHTGPMLACSVGARSLSRFDFTVIGDAVNTAARLQDAASEWEILASAATRSVVDDPQVRFAGPRSIAAEGKSAAMEAFAVERAGAARPG